MQNGTQLQFSPNRSCSLNIGSKSAVYGYAAILLQAWAFLLMGDLLFLARWKRSSNKCGLIYHPQHITGELGVIIHASRGMNRPFRGSWAQTLKRASPSSFSTVAILRVSDAVGSAYLVMNVVKFLSSILDNGKMCRIFFYSQLITWWV